MIRPVYLHIALVGLARAPASEGGSSPRAQLNWAAHQAARWSIVRGVRLDATAAGFRARELSRSARRDLAATLGRNELQFGGMDALVPSEHFTGSETKDRAMNAVTQACGLCADLAALGSAGTTSLCVALPEHCPEDVTDALAAAAERYGVRLADLTPRAERSRDDICVGVDPAAVIMSGHAPERAVSGSGTGLAVARLSDCNSSGRVPIGVEGAKLDVTAYAASVMLSSVSDVTLDLRGLPSASAGVAAAAQAWEAALTLPDTDPC